MLRDEQLKQAVLSMVGVLVLVYEYITERLAVPRLNLREAFKQCHSATNQVIEVHRVHPDQRLFVERVDIGHSSLEVVTDHLAVLGRPTQAVLGIGDLPLNCGRREALRVDAKFIKALFDQSATVGLVVDREAARVPDPLRLGTENPRAGRMERHHPHAAGRMPEQMFDAAAHHFSRLVRKGDCEDLAGAGTSGLHQPSQAMSQDAGLARTGAREHKKRTAVVRDSRALWLVKTLEQALDAFGCWRCGHHSRG